MRRFNLLFLRSTLLALFAAGLVVAPNTSWAQPEEETFEVEDTEDFTVDDAEADPGDDLGEEFAEGEPEPEPEGPEPELSDPDGDKNSGELNIGDVEAVSWKDIVVVVRKPFLKVNRVELLANWGVTMNDNIIRHYQLNGALNYYLTDVLAVGVEGQYYVKDLREPFDLVARQARRLPTVNQLNFGAALNFHYVPIYGKFAVLDKHIITWETALTAGVGITQSEVIPRDPAHQSFKNLLITPNVGVGMRFFLNRFLTVNLGIRDYVFVDKFEAASRTEANGDIAKEQADSTLVNNIMFQAGLAVWFPMSFEYTTFR